MNKNLPENIGPQIGCIVFDGDGRGGAFASHQIAVERERGNVVVIRGEFATIHKI